MYVCNAAMQRMVAFSGSWGSGVCMRGAWWIDLSDAIGDFENLSFEPNLSNRCDMLQGYRNRICNVGL